MGTYVPNMLDPDVTFHDPSTKGRCPTGKDRFATEHDAGLALVNCKIARVLHHKHKRKEQRYYCCSQCRGWHLTSKPLAARAVGETR